MEIRIILFSTFYNNIATLDKGDKYMNIFKIPKLILGLLVLVLLVSGCEPTDTDPTEEQENPTINFANDAIRIEQYDTIVLNPTITGSDTNLEIEFTIEEESILTYEGNTFLGLNTGTTTVTATLTDFPEITAEVEVTVTSLPEGTYTVTYHTDGGSLPMDARRKFTAETLPILLPTPQKEGLQFRGWYQSADFSDTKLEYVTIGTAENKTFYARWGEIMTQADYTFLDSVRDELRERLPLYAEKDIILPRTLFGFDGVEISWTSSKPEVVSNLGFVHQKYVQDFTLMTAKVTYKNEVFTYVFRVNVNPIHNTERIDYSRKYVFGYYYDAHATSFNIEHAKTLDYINYSFGGISASGTLALPNLSKLNSVLALKEHGVQVVLSVGGWSADGFSDAVYTAESRKKLIDSMIDAARTYGLAGYDIDWEFPGTTAGGIKSRPGDVQRFTTFLEELRTAMDELNPNMILTIAVGGSVSSYEPAKLDNILDFLHIMSYDLASFSEGAKAVHHTNLYTHSGLSNGSAKVMVDRYVQAGMEKSKIVIGAAFYGHRMTLDPNNLTPTGLGSTQLSRGAITYNNIRSQYLSDTARYTRYWDDTAKAPYIYGVNEQGEHVFISYDDPESIMHKAQYVKDEGLAGMMFWQYVEDSSGTLMEAIDTHLLQEDTE